MVAVDVCDYHAGTVAFVGASGQGGGVRGWAIRESHLRSGTGLGAGDLRIAPAVGLAFGFRDGWWWGRPALALPLWIPAFAGMTRGGRNDDEGGRER